MNRRPEMVPLLPARSRARSIMVLAIACLASACGAFAGNPGSSASTSSGTTTSTKGGSAVEPGKSGLSVAITDAPVDSARSVIVTITALEVHEADGGAWVSLPLADPAPFDLLALQGGLGRALGRLGSLEPGHYDALRLTLDPSSPAVLVDDAGVSHPMKVPSGSETGLKADVDFTLTADASSSLTIDFDLRKSVEMQGNGRTYSLKPTLRVVSDETAGAVRGETSASMVCVYAAGAERDSSSDCPSAVTSGRPKNGTYVIPSLPAGAYDVREFYADGTYKDVTTEVSADPRSAPGSGEDDHG